MTLGLNTNFGNVNPFGMMGTQSNIDYSKLNTYTNSIMNQVNTMSYSPLAEMSMANAMPGWFGQLMGCFNFTGFPGLDNKSSETKTTLLDKTKTTTEKTETAKKEEKAKVQKEAKVKKAKTEANAICEDFYVAMKGAGTDNKKLRSALERVNKDNVLEVMETYIKNYSEDMNGETLIESIQDEQYWGWFSNDLKNSTNKLKQAMAERAKEMGLEDEASSFSAKVTSENNRWWNTRDEVVAKHFNTMLAAMITKRDGQ